MVNPQTHWSSISVVCPLPLLYNGLHPPHLTNWSSISMVDPQTHWSSISVVCPLPPSLHWLTSSPPDQWIFYIHGQPTDPLIFYISGLSSTPSLQWLTSSPPDQLIFYINGLSYTPSLRYILHTRPMDLLYPWTHWSSMSVVCSLPRLTSSHLTNWYSISMVDPQTHWSSISVVCPLPLLYIGLHPPHLTNGGQPTDPLIFYISGLSSTPSLQWLTSSPPDQLIFYINGRPTDPLIFYYQWSVLNPFSTLAYILLIWPMVNPQTHWSSVSVVCPIPLLYVTSSIPDQWIFYFHGLIDLLCQWSVLYPGLHPPTWPIDILYQWSTHRPIDLLLQWSVLNPFSTLAYILLIWPMVNPQTHWSSISVVCPIPLLYNGLHPPHLTNWYSISMVDPQTHWSSTSVVCPQPLLYIGLHPPHLTNGQPTDPLIFCISGLSYTPSLRYILHTRPMDLLFPWTHWSSMSVVCSLPRLTSSHLTNGRSMSVVDPQTHSISVVWSVLYPLLYIGLHPPHLTNGLPSCYDTMHTNRSFANITNVVPFL